MGTQKPEPLQNLMKKHLPFFKDRLGTVEPYKAKFLVTPNATLIFTPSRSVPFTIKTAGHGLDHLEDQGIIMKVTHSDWAAPLVVVPNKDGIF